MINFSHIPVLLNETIEFLNIGPDKKYIDATLGGGGHTEKILQKGGIVLGIDQDDDALKFVEEKLLPLQKNLKIAKGNFKDIKKIAEKNGFLTVDGILFDLGVSSYQLDNSKRGFSFRYDEKLDMRMDPSTELTATEVVNRYSFERLSEIFLKYGEEHNAREIAHNIIDARKKTKIETTGQLSEIVMRTTHKSEPIHPATRVFQAIRIEVNDELNAIKEALDQSVELLNNNGRIVAISFHSLEDRIVKQKFAGFERQNLGKVINKKPTSASFEENMKNKRSRSAKLRVFERRK